MSDGYDEFIKPPFKVRYRKHIKGYRDWKKTWALPNVSPILAMVSFWGGVGV